MGFVADRERMVEHYYFICIIWDERFATEKCLAVMQKEVDLETIFMHRSLGNFKSADKNLPNNPKKLFESLSLPKTYHARLDFSFSQNPYHTSPLMFFFFFHRGNFLNDVLVCTCYSYSTYTCRHILT